MPSLEGTERAVAWGLRCRHQIQVGMSRACRRVRMAPAKAGAWPAARMARRAAGPEMLAPAWRSVWRALRVSAVARAVSMSRRSWMPSRLRDIGGVGYWNSPNASAGTLRNSDTGSREGCLGHLAVLRYGYRPSVARAANSRASDRSKAKITGREAGSHGVVRRLELLGARPLHPGEEPARWLAEILPASAPAQLVTPETCGSADSSDVLPLADDATRMPTRQRPDPLHIQGGW